MCICCLRHTFLFNSCFIAPIIKEDSDSENSDSDSDDDDEGV